MKKSQTIPISLVTMIVALCLFAIANNQPVFAESTTTANTTTKSAPDTTYHYNATTGLWENGTYSWDPNTGKTTPLAAQDYSYNPTTNAWDTTNWRYDSTTQTYVPNTPPPPPVRGPTGTTGPQTQTQTKSTVSPTTTAEVGPTSSVSTEPKTVAPPSQNDPIQKQSNTSSKSYFDGFYNASISNRIDSNAVTGDASVTGNTTGGSATSGNAQAIVNLINLLQSYWHINGGTLNTFTDNINGNVVGDLYIDPKNLQQNLPNGQGTNTTVKQQTNGLIDNTVNLGAQSGNATVDSNTTGGSSTSGNADAVANLINILNSAISSGQSFMGVINIYGNFEGDILLPPDVLNTLLASNGSVVPTTDLSLNTTDNQAINNNVTATATTGLANVDNNTTAGNATTGNALTNLTLLNLTGRQIIAKDTLLVFVNVLGRWVGVLLNAPSGSTAAALGGGVTTDNTIPVGDVQLSSTSNNAINNNVNVAAKTGNANVTNNTTAGNATTGNATASANLLNIIGSNLSFSDWFGVLFINVFGNWLGSFGINTPYGNPATPATANSADSANVFGFSAAPQRNNVTRLHYFVYGTAITALDLVNASDNQTDNGSSQDNQRPMVLASSDTDSGPSNPSLSSSTRSDAWVLPLLGLVVGSLLIGSNQAYEYVRRNRLA